jgi:hypothetical protein
LRPRVGLKSEKKSGCKNDTFTAGGPEKCALLAHTVFYP